jgi:Peptidase A4 family
VLAPHHISRRRTLPAMMASGALALAGSFGFGASSASAQAFKATQKQSQNWAGYVVKNSTGKGFSSISGSWTQPTAKASSRTAQGFSAFWVGLGGTSSRSQSLEQVGTSSDSVNGNATYYAWYELLPSAQVKLSIAIHPGDHISARVTVSASIVTVWLSDTTTRQSVTKSLRMRNPDTSSAEWIAESPSTTTQPGVYQTLPLANFGEATFTAAFATADGDTGSISDPSWSAAQVQLTPASNLADPSAGANFSPAGLAVGSQSSSGGASTGSVSADGTSFSVSYTARGSSNQPSSAGYGGFGNGGAGAGYGGAGYGYGAGAPYGVLGAYTSYP